MRKNKVTGVRLSEPEREALKKIGNGSLSAAIKQAIEQLFKQHKVKLA